MGDRQGKDDNDRRSMVTRCFVVAGQQTSDFVGISVARMPWAYQQVA
jgi:hypothetical protein